MAESMYFCRSVGVVSSPLSKRTPAPRETLMSTCATTGHTFERGAGYPFEGGQSMSACGFQS